MIVDEGEGVGGGRAHILGDPTLNAFQEPLMGLPDPFRKYWFFVREIKITIIHSTISQVMNTFSVLVIVEEPSPPSP